MIAISKWREHPATSELFKSGDIHGVVEVPVGQENTPDIRKSFALLAEGFFDSCDSTKKSAVNQVDTVIGNDQVVLHDESAHGNDLGHESRISDFVKKPTMDAF